MGYCPDTCTIELIVNPANCVPKVRLNTPARLIFYSCATLIPDSPSAIQDMIESGEIVFSSKLANFTLNDPTYQEIQINDCSPNQRLIASRELTFQDREALIGSGGSPATPIPYFDYDFWKNKIQNSPSLNVGIMYCNGEVRLALDDAGNPLSVDLTGFINYDTATTPGAPRPEFKQFSAIFNGDPLGFNKPLFTVNENTGVVTMI